MNERTLNSDPESHIFWHFWKKKKKKRLIILLCLDQTTSEWSPCHIEYIKSCPVVIRRLAAVQVWHRAIVKHHGLWSWTNSDVIREAWKETINYRTAALDTSTILCRKGKRKKILDPGLFFKKADCLYLQKESFTSVDLKNLDLLQHKTS